MKRMLDAFEAGKLGGPKVLNVNLQVGENQLAEVILDLNKRGFRVA